MIQKLLTSSSCEWPTVIVSVPLVHADGAVQLHCSTWRAGYVLTFKDEDRAALMRQQIIDGVGGQRHLVLAPTQRALANAIRGISRAADAEAARDSRYRATA